MQFKRYNCQKCGGSGDTKEANYRYRLSLEVADTHDVYEVTVFGSCLDAYFGATAKGLQRYIEELDREAGEDENDAVFGVVFRAVETCFVGKKFVFRIKSSDRPSGASLLQNGCPTERSTKTLVASEMFVPHPGLVGHTVIHYMEQQRCSQLKQRHGALWLPHHVTATDHASRELKSLPLWDDLDVTQSSRRNDFSAFWPHSFGLSWSSTSSENAEHSAAFISCQAASEQQKCEGGSVTSQRHLVYNLRGQNLMQDKRYGQENKTSCLYPSPQSVTTKDEPGGKPSIRRKDGDLLESPLALAQKDSSRRISIQSSCGLTNPQPPLPHQRPKERLASTSSPDATGGVTSQEASSEVLMEFLAELDNHSCTADLANGQEQRSASGPCEKSGEDKENKLPAEEQDYSLRRRDVYCSPGVGSSCPKANFDASADLFDISTTMLGPPITESLDKPSFVDLSRSKLFPTPSPVPHVADWSSELFPDHDHLPNMEATVSQPTS
ncbi:DNA damage-induced apoptosis suppressor protein [Crotalus adamanteus]|uniref:DNA damage-induced apoptosis suppressor protein n=1 Tax=Crotalus adamanteus TaxID=8729 RepID=A0AAW1BL46_CROAD